MLLLSNSLSTVPILSLRTGNKVATVTQPIINPYNLKIEGFYCSDTFDGEHLVLLTQDIRETLNEGFVIDDHEKLAKPSELIRLQKILDSDFELIGKHVETISLEKVGKVNDYTYENTTYVIQKLYVSQSFVRSLTGGNLLVDRSQINEITRSKIIIDDLLKPNKLPATAQS